MTTDRMEASGRKLGKGRRVGACRLPRGLSGRVARGLVLSGVVSVVAIAAGPAATALAAGLTITGPGSVTNDATPTFRGAAEPENGEVTLTIYSATGSPLQEREGSASTGSWKLTAGHLLDGRYTAQATQAGEAPVTATFTVDTTPPTVTLAAPFSANANAAGSQPVNGAAGTELGDGPNVTVQLFSGSTIGVAAPLEALTVSRSTAGSWSGTFGGLSPGTYTARAEQSDWAGNVGTSAPATFTITPAVGGAPPLASFRWFPTVPKTGENVSLVSSSTDSASPITAFAWALTGTGPFQAGKPVFTTSFSTPGGHVVRLRVTDGNGLSSVATQMIQVSSVPLTLMQPFPIVRIAGVETSRGVRLRLLTAQAPAGARVTVSCAGRGCPAKSESRVTASRKSKAGTFVVQFHRFERSLPDGVVLQIRISKPGEIGKYTRFAIHRGHLPERVDMCLGPAGGKPLVCPSS